MVKASRSSLSLLRLMFNGAMAVSLLSLAACGRSTLDEIDTSSGAGGSGGSGGSSSSTSHSHSASHSSSHSGTSTSTTTVTSTGTGSSCATADDCDDGDPCTMDQCQGGVCQHPLLDADGDGHVASQCGGDDCNDLNPEVFPGHPEVCGDGSDNDCNGVADCFDPACAGDPNCGCVPNPKGEICNNGKDDDCDGKADCNDPKCFADPSCTTCKTVETNCHDGKDDDCNGLIDCDDPACSGDTLCQCSQSGESCGDGVDNDCDGLIDCADPDCKGSFECSCQPPGTPENCSDGVDNDCDGLIDCADPDCLGSAECKHCVAEICNDGIDNNCDGKIDCADPSCFFDPHCAPTPEVCNDGIDNDHDGKIDCDDPDCANNPVCVVKQANCLSPKLIPGSGTYTGNTTGNKSETKGACGGDAGEAVFYFTLTQPTHVKLDSIGTSFDSVLYVRTGKCDSGREIGCDDDSAGKDHAAKLDFPILYPGTYYLFLDGYTIDQNNGPNEGPFVLNVDFEANPKEICNDGIDNDGDHFVDCADPDCKNAPNCLHCNGGADPTPEFGVDACTDGKDNDCDGKVDCADPDCKASDYYLTECCNGIDENMNGIVDDFNCRCASDADCITGQLCYTHTVFACGIPCDSFSGDVCPFVAPGSFCNHSTHQCEF